MYIYNLSLYLRRLFRVDLANLVLRLLGLNGESGPDLVILSPVLVEFVKNLVTQNAPTLVTLYLNGEILVGESHRGHCLHLIFLRLLGGLFPLLVHPGPELVRHFGLAFDFGEIFGDLRSSEAAQFLRAQLK